MTKMCRRASGASAQVVPALLLILSSIFLTSPAAAANFSREFLYSDIVHVNQTYMLETSGAVPFPLWAGSAALGIVLLILSLLSFPNGEEILVSIGAWFPIAYAMYSAVTAVDMVSGFGATSILSGSTQTFALLIGHTVYQWPVIAAGLFVLLLVAVGNTYRIHLNVKRLQQAPETAREDA